MIRRKHIGDKKNNLFIKFYSNQDLKNPDNIRLEYEKGIKLNNIINYPKPLKFDDKSISYEFLDIDFSIFSLLVSGKSLNYNYFKTIGQYLRKMHDNNLIHGDLSPINIVLDKKGKIYFLDASFSHHNTRGKVLMEADNIYHDISLFLVHLKISKPLYKPWMFFQFGKFKKMKEKLLEGYFKNRNEFNETENLKQEIFFMKNYLNIHKEKGITLRRLLKMIILSMNIWLNELRLKNNNF